MASPWLYEVSIHKRDGTELSGEPMRINMDSASLPVSTFKVDWKASEVSVRYAQRFGGQTSLENEVQFWRPLNQPATAP